MLLTTLKKNKLTKPKFSKKHRKIPSTGNEAASGKNLNGKTTAKDLEARTKDFEIYLFQWLDEVNITCVFIFSIMII